MNVPTRMVYRELVEDIPDANWATIAGPVYPGIAVSRSLLPDREEHLPVRVMNTSNRPSFL